MASLLLSDSNQLLLKHALGRAGFDASRRWYEEAVSHSILPVDARDVRIDALPTALPPLLEGGAFRISHLVDGATYDSSGAEPAADGGGIARLHVRRPLYVVPTYEGLGVFSDVADVDPNAALSSSALKRCLDARRFGLVVEALLADGSFVLVDDVEFVSIDACIAALGTAPSSSLFATFYEYIGRSVTSVPALTSAAAIHQYTDGALTFHRDATTDEVTWSVRPLSSTSTTGELVLDGTTDDLREGVSSLYFTPARAVEAVARARPAVLTPWSSTMPTVPDADSVVHVLSTRATTDDLSEGSSHLYLTPERVLSIAASLVPSTTDGVPEGASNVYFTAERVLSVASRVVPRSLDDLGDGVSRFAYSRERVLSDVEPVVVSRISSGIGLIAETAERRFLTTERVLSIATPMAEAVAAAAAAAVVVPRTTDDIIEGTTRVYFTPSRAVDAIVGGSVSLDHISDGAVRRLVTAEEVLEAVEAGVSAAAVPTTTDSLAEGAARLYFTPPRVLSVVLPELERASQGVLSVVGADVSALSAASAGLASRLDVIEAWTTADVVESAGAMFHTDERVVDAVRRLVTSDDIRGGGQNVYFTPAAAEAAAVRVVSSLELQSRAQVSEIVDARLSVATSALTTSDVPEGGNAENVYFTVERADARVRIALDAMSSDDVREGSIHKYASHETLSSWLSTRVSTDNVAEGRDRLYFTPSRAVSAVLGSTTLDDIVDGAVRRIPRTTSEIAESPEYQYWTSSRASSLLEAAEASAFAIASVAASSAAPGSTDDLVEGAVNLFFTSERCLRVCGAEASRQIGSLTTDSIPDPSGRYFDASRVDAIVAAGIAAHASATESRTLDSVADGATRRLLTPEDVLSVSTMVTESALVSALHTSAIREDASAQYFTADRVLSVVAPALSVMAADASALESASLSVAENVAELTARSALMAASLENVEASMTARADGIDARLSTLSSDDVPPGSMLDRQYMTPGGFGVLFAEHASRLTTSDVPEPPPTSSSTGDASGPRLYFSEARCASVVRSLAPTFSLDTFQPGIIAAPMDVEVFRFMLSQCSTDDLIPGSSASRRYYDADATARAIEASATMAAEGVAASVSSVVDARFHVLFATKTTNDLRSTARNGYLHLDLLRQLMRTSLTTDDLPQGGSNFYFTPSGFAALGITTQEVPEATSALYFTAQRCRDAIVGVSADAFVDGSRNRFASMSNVRRALTETVGIDTSHLAEHPDFRYVSRSSVLELGLRMTDMLGHEAFATDSELSSAITSLRALTSDAVLSVQMMVLEEAEAVRLELSVSAEELRARDSRLQRDLSVASSELSLSMSNLGDALRADLSVAVYTLDSSTLRLGASVRSELSIVSSSLSESTRLLGAAVRSELSVAASAIDASTAALGVAVRSELSAVASDLLVVTSDLASTFRSELSAAVSGLSAETGSLGLSIRSDLSAVASALSVSTSDLGAALRAEAASSTLALSASISALSVSAFTAVATSREFVLRALEIGDDLVRAELVASVSDAVAASESRLGAHIADESALLNVERLRIDTLISSLGSLRTSGVVDVPGSRYVSRAAMTEAGVTVKDLVGYAASLRAGFDDAWRSVSTDDLREGRVNRFVSRESVVATGLGISDIALASDGVDARAFSDSNLLRALSSIVDTSNIRESPSTNRYFTDARAASAAAASVSSGGVVASAVIGAVVSNVALHDLRDTGVYVRYADLRTDVVTESPGRRFVSRDAIIELSLRTDELGGDTPGRRFVSPSALREAGVTTSDIAETPSRGFYSHDRFLTSMAQSTTDMIPEGTSNLYFSSRRARDAIDAQCIIDTGVTARSLGGRMVGDIITTDDLFEGSNRFYSHALFEASVALTTSDAVAEGSTNLYFTEARVRSALASPPVAPGRVDVRILKGRELEVEIAMPPPEVTLSTPDFVVVRLFRVDNGETVYEADVRGIEAVEGVVRVLLASPLLHVPMRAGARLRSAVHGYGPLLMSESSVSVPTPVAVAILGTDLEVSALTGCISHIVVRFVSSVSDMVQSASLTVGGVVVTGSVAVDDGGAAEGSVRLRVVGVSPSATVSVTTRSGEIAVRVVEIPSASVLASSIMTLVVCDETSLQSDAIYALPAIREDVTMNLHLSSMTFYDINRWGTGVTVDVQHKAGSVGGHDMFIETFGDPHAEIGLLLQRPASRTIILMASGVA